jgi:hypothetical protein
MVIDYSITIGNLIEIASIIGGGLMVMVTLRGDVANIKAGMGGIQLEVKKIGDVLITQADQNRRILHLEEDFREGSDGLCGDRCGCTSRSRRSGSGALSGCAGSNAK